MTAFGENLKRIRSQRGWTQTDMADALGTSKQVISRYENGVRSPKISVVAAFAKKLGMTISELSNEEVQSGTERIISVDTIVSIPVVGTIRCGPGGLAYQDIEAYIPAANVKYPSECFYLRVEGDSMEPAITDGDLALIRKQPDVESGELAAVVIDGEEGTLKKVIKKGNSLILQAFNPAYPPRVFTGHEMDVVCIVGKVIRTEKEW